LAPGRVCACLGNACGGHAHGEGERGTKIVGTKTVQCVLRQHAGVMQPCQECRTCSFACYYRVDYRDTPGWYLNLRTGRVCDRTLVATGDDEHLGSTLEPTAGSGVQIVRLLEPRQIFF